ncbi:MAG: trigger factor [Thermomicrobiales bacterium]
MKLSVERKPDSLVVLDITAEEEEFSLAVDNAIKKAARTVQIPGFRKGKASPARVEKMYGRETFLQEATDGVMDRLYREALKQEELVPVGDPSVEIVQIEPVQFVVTVPVYPTPVLGDYSTIRVDPIDAATTDDDVQEVIDRLQRSQSPWIDVTEVRSPVDGEQVTVDYEVFDGEEEFQKPIKDAVFILGETNLLSQLSDKLKELKVGESDSFELVFDEDDETADPTIRGKVLKYNVDLKAIHQRDLIAIDEEFAKKVADTDSVEELRVRIFEDVHQGKTNDARTQIVNSIIEQLVDRSELDLPHAMIHEEAHARVGHLQQEVQRSGTPFEAYLRMQNKTEEDIAVEMEPEAERRLRSSMLVQEFARAENVEVNDEDIDAEITKVVGEAPTDGDDAELAKFEQTKTLYNGTYFRNMMKNQLFDQKVTDRLIEIATEGRGAVINAYVAPVVIEAEGTEIEVESEVLEIDPEIIDVESEVLEVPDETQEDS